ncbi:hypothetical protein GCM10010172_09750 [Paractinoplanes ferrugineus]|uniref:Uncharacterized protein n=1 Tax=Paractinoplanes ferrugineus TaxID=113564 RepID=A0A919MEH8_9ACTN|nr:hypothetical protein [Actinoplanes ferrugineus]GIE09540.1 hypothetical protein Afe05nite_13800 [Actinoplanes ferrugineus]
MIECTLCGRLVLGLTGYDWTVVPWMLAPATGVMPGPCHVSCLQERGAAGSWAAAVEAYHRERWPRWLAGVDAGVGWRLHSSRAARRFHLWRSDGAMASFAYAVLTVAPHRTGTDLAELGTAHAATLLAAMGTDRPGSVVPLPRMIERLRLTDRYPFVEGTVTLRRGVVVADHPLALTRACLRAAHQLAAEGADTYRFPSDG